MSGTRAARGLTLAALLAATAAFDMVLIHTNDMHARIDEISQGAGNCRPGAKCYGGFARLKKEVDSIRSRYKNVVFVNAGDSFQGTPFYTYYKWKGIRDFIDLLGIDAMSLGNHEFDDGVGGLMPYLKTVKTPVVTCNLDTSEEPGFEGYSLKPWITLNIENTSLAIVGYLTPDTEFLSSTGKVKFDNVVMRVQEAAKKAKEEGADIVIAVGHAGYDVDLEVAENVPDVDVVVGGHTNTFLYTGTPPDIEVPASSYPHMVEQLTGKMVPVVQAFAYTKYLGFLQLSFDKHYSLRSAKGNPILLDHTYPKDPEIDEMVQHYKVNISQRMSKVIGKTRVNLQGSCRMNECNTGNLVADAWIDSAVHARIPRYGWTSSPIAFLNGGSVRAPIDLNSTEGGQITEGTIITVLPFENEVMMLDLKGSTLLKTLEEAVAQYDPTGIIQKGSFLQVSGLKVVYDISAPPGKRVVEALARCQRCEVPSYSAVNPDVIYTVVTNSFLANGGDNLGSLNEALLKENLGVTESQSVMDYIAKMGTVYPGVEGRVSFIAPRKDPSPSRYSSDGQTLMALGPLVLATSLYHLRSWP